MNQVNPINLTLYKKKADELKDNISYLRSKGKITEARAIAAELEAARLVLIHKLNAINKRSAREEDFLISLRVEVYRSRKALP